jgi:hypothetical protein
MNVSLFFWFAILLCILEPYTTYDVTSRSERPHVKLLLSAHSNQAARQAADHIRSMAPDIPSAHKWDSPAAVRTWRQQRYDTALATGASVQDGIIQSLPVHLQGFFDDGQTVTVRCLFNVLVQSLILMISLIGLKLSWAKVQRARPGHLASVRVPPEVNTFRDFLWTWEALHAKVLGRQLRLDSMIVTDTAERIAEATRRLLQLEAVAAGHPGRLVKEQSYLSLLGVIVYIVILQKQIRQMLNRPFACLRASKSLLSRVNFTAAASSDLSRALQYVADPNTPKRAFYPTTYEELLPRPVVFIMNDSAGAVMTDGTVVDDDDSYRGGGCWIFAPHSDPKVTPWSVFEWPRQVLHGNYSTSLETDNANCSLDYAVLHYPGHIIVEVLDSASSVHILKRLACAAPELRPLLERRSDIIHLLDARQRVLTIWACREDGTLADMLSKHELEAFATGLEQRGLPPPAQAPFTRGQPQLR